MFSEIKNKHETVKKCDSGKEAQKLPLKEIKYTEKTPLSKFFTSYFAAPFLYKAAGQEINEVHCQVENTINGICF